jgi:hypothetical protein
MRHPEGREMELALIIWIGCGIGSAAIASNRGGSGCLWFVLGILLGPFGLALAWFASGSNTICYYCRKPIHPEAKKCPYWQSVFTSKT